MGAFVDDKIADLSNVISDFQKNLEDLCYYCYYNENYHSELDKIKRLVDEIGSDVKDLQEELEATQSEVAELKEKIGELEAER